MGRAVIITGFSAYQPSPSSSAEISIWTIKHLYIKHLFYLFLSLIVTGCKEGSCKVGLIASTTQHKKNIRNHNESASLGQLVIITVGLKPVLRCANIHPHLPPRFTQLSWLFGLHGGFLAHYECVGQQLKSMKKTVMKQGWGLDSYNALRPGDHLGVCNTTETLLQKKKKKEKHVSNK